MFVSTLETQIRVGTFPTPQRGLPFSMAGSTHTTEILVLLIFELHVTGILEYISDEILFRHMFYLHKEKHSVLSFPLSSPPFKAPSHVCSFESSRDTEKPSSNLISKTVQTLNDRWKHPSGSVLERLQGMVETVVNCGRHTLAAKGGASS